MSISPHVEGVDEQRLAVTQMPLPVGIADLVLDEHQRRGGIGNPQQGLGEGT